MTNEKMFDEIGCPDKLKDIKSTLRNYPISY